jgi:hypothetical protein
MRRTRSTSAPMLDAGRHRVECLGPPGRCTRRGVVGGREGVPHGLGGCRDNSVKFP